MSLSSSVLAFFFPLSPQRPLQGSTVTGPVRVPHIRAVKQQIILLPTLALA